MLKIKYLLDNIARINEIIIDGYTYVRFPGKWWNISEKEHLNEKELVTIINNSESVYY